MSSLRAALYIVIALAVPFSLGGCVVAAVGGAAAAGGYVAGQERGVKGTVSDMQIKSGILQRWAAIKPRLPMTQMDATVYEGRVLLTGAVPTAAAKASAEQVATRTLGVRAVYDRITVGPPEPGWRAAKDTWITARLRSSLVFASHVRSVNYTIETEAGTVYLMGSARTQQELNRVTNIARYTPGVKQVVSYVEIRPGAPTVAQRQAPPTNLAPTGNAAAAPVAPVTAQRL